MDGMRGKAASVHGLPPGAGGWGDSIPVDGGGAVLLWRAINNGLNPA